MDGINHIAKETGSRIQKTGEFDSVLGHSRNFIFDKDGITVQTSIRETDNAVYLNSIATKRTGDLSQTATGTGKGMQVINSIKNYADKTGKKMIVPDATKNAIPFWEKIPFLNRDYSVFIDIDGEMYNPPNTFSYTP